MPLPTIQPAEMQKSPLGTEMTLVKLKNQIIQKGQGSVHDLYPRRRLSQRPIDRQQLTEIFSEALGMLSDIEEDSQDPTTN